MGILQRNGRGGRQHPGGRVARFGGYRTRFCMSGHYLQYLPTDLIPGWSICRLPFCLPCLLNPPARIQQHRRRNGCPHPHLTTTQQLDNACI